MSNVLTASSNVQCSHAGTISVTGVPKLTIQGMSALVEAGIAAKSVARCSTPASSTTKPCTTVIAVAAGRAIKLKVAGQPVILDTLAGATDGNPPGKLQASTMQTKLKAI